VDEPIAESPRLHTRSLFASEPVKVQGKFFFVGEEKFLLKGVTYGPFPPGTHGAEFPEKPMVERDFSLMAELGANCVRTFTVPPEWLLDCAANHGLRVLIGIPWAQHVCFAGSPSLRREIRQTIANGVRAGRGHVAAFAYLAANEVPPDIVRWHGPDRVGKFLRELAAVAKDTNPDILVSFANFPSTEYLDTSFADFVAFNLYLHREQEFRHYLARLHNLAEDRPLVLTEFGIDSIREGTEHQAEILSWQVETSFKMGVAGTVVFAWTDEWFTGGFAVQDWAFGLVDRERTKKPAFHAVQQRYTGTWPPKLSDYPDVSVIVCAYNAARTLDACLASLEKLTYPNYEVIVVNDGSTDTTPDIARHYSYARLINQNNQGLSAARNVGIAAATGDIIAFTDSDCVADPDWLFHLVAKFLSSNLPAVGGPNFAPPEPALVPACVAVSPGGPTHVLLSDEVAEHVPGCNMAFRREALEEVGGFDPVFRAAGDDVDLCWRLQNKGYAIGFSPTAVVWHFRRNTIRAYLKQQRGYGQAEALLYFKHPYRFNMLGQSRWLGRIYGDLSSFFLSRRPVIYSGVFGRGLFQTLYEPPASLMAYLPLTLEWNAAALFVFAGALLSGDYAWAGVVPLLMTWAWCASSAWRARIDPRFNGLRARSLVALLIYLGPLVRSLERYRWRIRGLTEVEPIDFAAPTQVPRMRWRRLAFQLSYWTEEAKEKESLLQGLIDFFLPRKYFIAFDQGWSNWDLQVYRGIWSKAQVKVATENHGGGKRLHRARCALRMTRPAMIALATYPVLAVVALMLDAPEAATAAMLLGAVNAAAILYQGVRLGRTLYHALEIVARQLRFVPGGEILTPRLEPAEQPVRAEAHTSLAGVDSGNGDFRKRGREIDACGNDSARV
jgi:O-antigen biosynthesis protein